MPLAINTCVLHVGLHNGLCLQQDVKTIFPEKENIFETRRCWFKVNIETKRVMIGTIQRDLRMQATPNSTILRKNAQRNNFQQEYNQFPYMIES